MADAPTKTATKTPHGAADADTLAAEQARVRAGVTDEDGGDDVVRRAEPVDEGAVEPAPERRLTIDNTYAEKRSDIAKLARAKREREAEDARAEQAGARDDGEGGDSALSPADGDDGVGVDAGEGGEGDAPASHERKMKLKVDGQDIEMLESEVVALAQKYKASDNRYDTSKEVLAALKSITALSSQLTANQRGTGASGKDSPDPSHLAGTAADQPDSQADDDLNLADLEAKVERLQVGDTKEGAQALLEMLRDQQARIEKRVKAQTPDVTATVRSEIAADRLTQDVAGAVERYHKTYPEIQEKPLLREAAGAAARDELISDLTKAGADPKDLERLGPKKMVEAHQQLRAQGHKLRSYDDILTAAAKKVSSELGFKFKAHEKPAAEPAPKTNGQVDGKTDGKTPPQRIVVSEEERQARLERKRNTQQPRTAGVRGQPGQGNQQQRPKTPQEIVQQMKAARHFR